VKQLAQRIILSTLFPTYMLKIRGCCDAIFPLMLSHVIEVIEASTICHHKIPASGCADNSIIHGQDDEIAELKAKMDDMAEEFGEMLRVSCSNSLSSRTACNVWQTTVLLKRSIFIFISSHEDFLLYIRIKIHEIPSAIYSKCELKLIFLSNLQETLETMRERIEVSSGNFDAPDLPIQHRMEEIRTSDYK
jgi:hypothetical protein